jgi:hypothetical protein
LRLIPEVKSLKTKDGFFRLGMETPVILGENRSELFFIAQLLIENIRSVTGVNLKIITEGNPDEKGIRFVLNAGKNNDSDEFYRIKIDKDAIFIEGATTRALLWATQTLTQIIMNSGLTLQCLEIEDFPDFAHRGFYHDITRGKVPKLETLKKLVEKAAFYKLNELQLYIEHSFAFRNIPELWIDKDPLTANDILELDDYCRKFQIDLIPSLATFGHLYELLRLKKFSHLNELNIDASELPHDLWDRMAHYTIDPSNEESFKLISSMIEEFLPLFTSKYFNICCDETFDLGKGKNLAVAQREGTGRLYVDFVKKICGVVMEHGKVPMLWGDIVLHRPELIAEVPKEAVFLNWGYTADVKEDNTKTFGNAGVKHYTCPGTQGWSRFANDINTATVNIRKMIGFGREHNASGVLVTDWGDCGHVNFLAGSYHGLVLGAALSWKCDSFQDDYIFDNAFGNIEWNDSEGKIVKLLRELGSLCFYHFGNLYAWVNNKECLWYKEEQVRNTSFEDLAEKFSNCERIINELVVLKKNGVAGCRPDIDEFICAAHAIRWTIALLIFKKVREYGQRGSLVLMEDELISEAGCIVEEFKILWRLRNRESELHNVVDTFRRVIEKIRVVDQ